MKRFRRLLLVLAAVASVLLATRFYRHQQARTLALPVVTGMGGRIGSITAPFGGTEYYVSFNGRTLTRNDADRLAVLNDLAGNWNYVGLSLENADITPEDREYLKKVLSSVHVWP